MFIYYDFLSTIFGILFSLILYFYLLKWIQNIIYIIIFIISLVLMIGIVNLMFFKNGSEKKFNLYDFTAHKS